MHPVDVTLLTDSRYANPTEINWYTQNILDDDKLVQQAFEKKGLTVTRTFWDNPDYDWTKTRCALFRTTWDYFDRFNEFSLWLNQVSKQTQLINPTETIRWNIDKHYLSDLNTAGIKIPSTIFIEPGESRSLTEIFNKSLWETGILKPAVSGAARHTYKLTRHNVAAHEEIFKQLIQNESMLLQEFQHQILTKGEVALMVFGGKYSHAILKKAKPGDFRVQDDFGGTVHEYEPTATEIEFVEKVVSKVKPLPAYARVDIIWDNFNNLCVSELELIEPELWFRKHPPAADKFAETVHRLLTS
jgi:glutathione synthase/RimK-type ligase-like ATP-grasp enzyme